MKPATRRAFPAIAAFLATAAVALAHPGHEGHELTWDVSAGHLAAHPLATLICSLVLVAGAWGVGRLVGAGSDYVAAVVRRGGARRRD